MSTVHTSIQSQSFRALEEAREAVIKLGTLKSFLSPQDEETIALLMDTKLMVHLERSMNEASDGQFEPLENILE